MKTTTLLIIWMIFTFILAVSVIGWVLLLPQPNHTSYHKPLSEVRSTWMQIGIDLKDKLLNS
jgi:hypothetical protein